MPVRLQRCAIDIRLWHCIHDYAWVYDYWSNFNVISVGPRTPLAAPVSQVSQYSILSQCEKCHTPYHVCRKSCSDQGRIWGPKLRVFQFWGKLGSGGYAPAGSRGRAPGEGQKLKAFCCTSSKFLYFRGGIVILCSQLRLQLKPRDAPE